MGGGNKFWRFSGNQTNIITNEGANKFLTFTLHRME